MVGFRKYYGGRIDWFGWCFGSRRWDKRKGDIILVIVWVIGKMVVLFFELENVGGGVGLGWEWDSNLVGKFMVSFRCLLDI